MASSSKKAHLLTDAHLLMLQDESSALRRRRQLTRWTNTSED